VTSRNPAIIIRSETDADVSIITEVTVAAFKTLEISNHTEQFIIEALRAAKALTLSLVAEIDGCVVGHIAFSPVTISDDTKHWYGLGSLSVLPEYQRKGVGKALIQEGLAQLKDLGAKGCCVVGHPTTTGNSGSRTCRDLCLREFHPRSFSLCLSTVTLRRAPSLSTKDSKLMTQKLLQQTADLRR